jgi:hypothetical protein
MRVLIRGEIIESFANLTGTCLEDAKFSVITIHRTRIPTCRALTISERYLDDAGKEKLKEALKKMV